MSSILNGLFADHGMDQPDFNSSFRSAGSSNRISSASGEEMSILSFDEPKEFTQIPKSLNLIAPKPLSPQVSKSEGLGLVYELQSYGKYKQIVPLLSDMLRFPFDCSNDAVISFDVVRIRKLFSELILLWQHV